MTIQSGYTRNIDAQWDATFGRGREERDESDERCERCCGYGKVRTWDPVLGYCELLCPTCHGTGKRPAGEEDGRG